MLNKIGMLTWIEAMLLTVLVGHYVPSVSAVLTSVKLPIKVFELEVPVLYVVPGTVVALAARIFRLHNGLANLFRIREHFDVSKILLPLSGAVGTPVSMKKLREKRVVAMRRTFYAYASFDEPKISKALVLSAIDTWTWYWALLELAFLLAITAAVVACFRAFKPAIVITISAALSSLFFLTVFRVGGRKARHQVDEITSDTGRAEEIKREFAAL